MLEDSVDEKFYLKDSQVMRIKNSTYLQNQRRIQEKEWCDTLCARDWKDPKCVQVCKSNQSKNIEDIKLGGAYGRNYGSKGKIENEVCSTLQAAMGNGGGNVPLVKDFSYVEKKYKEFFDKNGYIPEMFNPYNVNEVQDVAPTQTSNCGGSGSSATVLKVEETPKKINVLGNYMPSEHNASRVVDSNGIAPTVKENHGTVTATNVDFRIRKLTPRECWRLMGFSDKDFDNAQATGLSNTQLYKEAGNSIVVNVLERIFKNLFLE